MVPLGKVCRQRTQTVVHSVRTKGKADGGPWLSCIGTILVSDWPLQITCQLIGIAYRAGTTDPVKTTVCPDRTTVSSRFWTSHTITKAQARISRLYQHRGSVDHKQVSQPTYLASYLPTRSLGPGCIRCAVACKEGW